MKLSELGDLQISKLRFYSVGVVAQNKALGSKVIEVTPLETTPFVDGSVNAKLTSGTATGVDSSGAAYSVTASTGNSIRATWLALSNPNRLTAPDVQRNETVVIYQFADENTFFWSTVLDDYSLRRLETVIYGISATSAVDAKLTPDNMYWLEWSSHKKVIHLHTSKANGEPFAYDIQLNMKDGALTIQDDIGNVIQLNSPEHRIELKNTDGSHYDMHEKNLTVTIPDITKFVTKDFVIRAERNIDFDARLGYKLLTPSIDAHGENSATYTAPSTSINASDTCKIDAGELGASANNVDIGASSSIFIHSPATAII